jgi:competence protein ComEA
MKRWLSGLALGMALALPAGAAVDVNTATQADLESVSGIGPTKAKAIMEYRAKNGAFKSIGDLELVPGIGAKTLEKIKKDLTVGKPAK